MTSIHPLRITVKFHFLLVLVATLGSGVRGHPCEKGEVAHEDGGRIRCCKPVYCEPDHHVQYCRENGTNDSCASCGQDHWLLKRTSSFNPEQCWRRRVISPGSSYGLQKPCDPIPGPIEPTMEEVKSCFCNLETGYYYMKPEVSLFPTSKCQPFPRACSKGQQPTVNGTCEPCPANTFQDEDDSFKLCRALRNCTALGLDVVEAGSPSRDTSCTTIVIPDPPIHPQPPKPPTTPTTPSTTKTTTSSKTTVTGTDNGTNVRPVLEGGAGTDTTDVIIIAVVCSILLVMLICLIVVARRKGWLRRCGCRGVESPPSQTSEYGMSNRGDNDNTSDNSCCACADSCIATSSKSSSNGACGKSGASASPDTKLPMLEGYMNMNGKCVKGSPGEVSMSEPFYSSIPAGGEGKLGNGNVASYTNVNGVRPTFLRQDDFYNYPNKVHIPSSDDDDENNAVNKERQAKRLQAAGQRGEAEGFTETDPLLPNVESASSSAPTPEAPQPLRGILRNGNNNRQEPRGRGGGGGGGGTVAGNRPNLSMLLSDPESYSSGDSAQMQNLPHLSQLMSNSSRSNASSLPNEAPEQHVHELPRQLQERLLQQQQQQQQQQNLQQEAPTLATRLVPAVPVSSATQPQLNPSLVKMEELKPVMPLNPSPAVNSPSPAPPTGAANVTDNRGRSGSPARISPSQQEEVRGRGVCRETVSPKTVNTSGKSTAAGKGASWEEEKDAQTYKKQAIPASSPEGEDDEETAHKSVGGSSGLGDSLDMSSLSEEGRRSRNQYRRSQSEVSRSVSPSQPLPRSISSPEEKHRPYAVVKPMQSDQSLNTSHDQLTELAQQLDSDRCQFPLHSLRPHNARRQVSQESSDDADQTRPKTPDRLSEDENEETDTQDNGAHNESDDRTRAHFYGNNDTENTEDNEGGECGKDKPADGDSEG